MQQHEEPEEIKSQRSVTTHDDRTSEITISTNVPASGPKRHGTGPRTLEGKERSKHNATRHGIFSTVIVLSGEACGEYESLLNGLWEALGPEGGLEELLVEKLATISWRHRRLLVAEGAEIRRNTEFLEQDQRSREHEEAEETAASSMLEYKGGLIRQIRNPDVLNRCLELLVELREGLETDGFDEERDASILEKIYGGGSLLRETLHDSYPLWFRTAETPEEERRREGYADPKQCKQNVLDKVDAEIKRLKQYRKTRETIESDRHKLEVLRRSVPESPGLDRILRYEANLERSFDRALNQLDRLQRTRRGQPVTPRIDVNLSA